MKKNIFYLMIIALVATTLASCSKDSEGKSSIVHYPKITLKGDAFYISPQGQPFTDPGCTVTYAGDDYTSHVVISGGEDYWGLAASTGNAKTRILTYNMTANDPTQLWVNILGIGNFAADYDNPNYPNYDFKIKVNCNQTEMTFAATEAENIADPVIWSHEEEDENGETKVVIDDQVDPMPVTIEGKILKLAGHQNNGTPADSIIIYVTYKDDPWYPDDGYAKYKISGIRYSGLVEND